MSFCGAGVKGVPAWYCDIGPWKCLHIDPSGDVSVKSSHNLLARETLSICNPGFRQARFASLHCIHPRIVYQITLASVFILFDLKPSTWVCTVPTHSTRRLKDINHRCLHCHCRFACQECQIDIVNQSLTRSQVRYKPRVSTAFVNTCTYIHRLLCTIVHHKLLQIVCDISKHYSCPLTKYRAHKSHDLTAVAWVYAGFA